MLDTKRLRVPLDVALHMSSGQGIEVDRHGERRRGRLYRSHVPYRDTPKVQLPFHTMLPSINQKHWTTSFEIILHLMDVYPQLGKYLLRKIGRRRQQAALAVRIGQRLGVEPFAQSDESARINQLMQPCTEMRRTRESRQVVSSDDLTRPLP